MNSKRLYMLIGALLVGVALVIGLFMWDEGDKASQVFDERTVSRSERSYHSESLENSPIQSGTGDKTEDSESGRNELSHGDSKGEGPDPRSEGESQEASAPEDPPLDVAGRKRLTIPELKARIAEFVDKKDWEGLSSFGSMRVAQALDLEAALDLWGDTIKGLPQTRETTFVALGQHLGNILSRDYYINEYNQREEEWETVREWLRQRFLATDDIHFAKNIALRVAAAWRGSQDYQLLEKIEELYSTVGEIEYDQYAAGARLMQSHTIISGDLVESTQAFKKMLSDDAHCELRAQNFVSSVWFRYVKEDGGLELTRRSSVAEYIAFADAATIDIIKGNVRRGYPGRRGRNKDQMLSSWAVFQDAEVLLHLEDRANNHEDEEVRKFYTEAVAAYEAYRLGEYDLK